MYMVCSAASILIYYGSERLARIGDLSRGRIEPYISLICYPYELQLCSYVDKSYSRSKSQYPSRIHCNKLVFTFAIKDLSFLNLQWDRKKIIAQVSPRKPSLISLHTPVSLLTLRIATDMKLPRTKDFA